MRACTLASSQESHWLFGIAYQSPHHLQPKFWVQKHPSVWEKTSIKLFYNRAREVGENVRRGEMICYQYQVNTPTIARDSWWIPQPVSIPPYAITTDLLPSSYHFILIITLCTGAIHAQCAIFTLYSPKVYCIFLFIVLPLGEFFYCRTLVHEYRHWKNLVVSQTEHAVCACEVRRKNQSCDDTKPLNKRIDNSNGIRHCGNSSL